VKFYLDFLEAHKDRYKVNIIYTWLLLFLGSLKYNLDSQHSPWFVPKDQPHEKKVFLQLLRRIGEVEHKERRKDMQLLLGQYFEQVFFTLIYKIEHPFDYNVRGFPLELLYA
jgi:hypothetical protein